MSWNNMGRSDDDPQGWVEGNGSTIEAPLTEEEIRIQEERDNRNAKEREEAKVERWRESNQSQAHRFVAKVHNLMDLDWLKVCTPMMSHIYDGTVWAKVFSDGSVFLTSVGEMGVESQESYSCIEEAMQWIRGLNEEEWESCN